VTELIKSVIELTKSAAELTESVTELIKSVSDLMRPATGLTKSEPDLVKNKGFFGKAVTDGQRQTLPQTRAQLLCPSMRQSLKEIELFGIMPMREKGKTGRAGSSRKRRLTSGGAYEVRPLPRLSICIIPRQSFCHVTYPARLASE
jgi:hypothetical protein